MPFRNDVWLRHLWSWFKTLLQRWDSSSCKMRLSLLEGCKPRSLSHMLNDTEQMSQGREWQQGWRVRGLIHSWVRKQIKLIEIRAKFGEKKKTSKTDFPFDCSLLTTGARNMFTVWCVCMYTCRSTNMLEYTCMFTCVRCRSTKMLTSWFCALVTFLCAGILYLIVLLNHLNRSLLTPLVKDKHTPPGVSCLWLQGTKKSCLKQNHPSKARAHTLVNRLHSSLGILFLYWLSWVGMC